MISISLPKVLFIKSVFKRDCATDDFLEKKVLETINNEAYIGDVINNVVADIDAVHYSMQQKIAYKKLPSVFESIEEWPKRTNLLCWHCSLPFDTVPIFIPKVIEPVISKVKLNQYSIGVSGVFCSFSDALEFIVSSNWSIMDKIEAKNKLKHLHKIFHNAPLKDSISYPSVFEMIQYGGDLEITQYREIINRFKTSSESTKKLNFGESNI